MTHIRERTYFLCYFKNGNIIKRKEFRFLPLMHYYLMEHMKDIEQHPEIALSWHEQFECHNLHPINFDFKNQYVYI